jgi:hypothetical protein
MLRGNEAREGVEKRNVETRARESLTLGGPLSPSLDAPRPFLLLF